MPVRFHPAAQAELVDARNWYRQARANLGENFTTEVERVVQLIEFHPSRFPFHDDPVRRASLRRFPFSLYFEESDGSIYIWAVFHHRRDPVTWQRRRT